MLESMLPWNHYITKAIGIAAMFGAVTAMLAACQPAAPPTLWTHVVDLTHTLSERTPYIPIPGLTFPFKKTPIATLAANGVAAYRWDIHEHIGTQIDAPSHFIEGGIGLEALPVDSLLVPLAVIDVSDRARSDADTAVTVRDILEWEKAHGRLPARAAVVMRSGWDAKIADQASFANPDAAGVLHFPGISPEAAEFLARDRDVSGIGVDTLSVDPGVDKTYQTHRVWLGTGRWAVELVANLAQVPPVGAMLFVGATKVEGATGGPVRLLAVTPAATSGGAVPVADARAPNIRGFWEHDACQVQERDGRRSGSLSRFAIFDREWGIAFTQYADAECSTPVMTAVLRGVYEPPTPSTRVPGTYEVTFRFSYKGVVAHDAALLTRLNTGLCGNRQWTLGVEQDVTSTGCLSIESVSACPQEYDLVSTDGERLSLGERPPPGENICTEERRPQRLRAVPLHRR